MIHVFDPKPKQQMLTKLKKCLKPEWGKEVRDLIARNLVVHKIKYVHLHLEMLQWLMLILTIINSFQRFTYNLHQSILDITVI